MSQYIMEFEDYEEDIYRLFEELTEMYVNKKINTQNHPKLMEFYLSLKQRVDKEEENRLSRGRKCKKRKTSK